MKIRVLSLMMTLMLAFVGVAKASTVEPEENFAAENLSVYESVNSAVIAWSGLENTSYKVSCTDGMGYSVTLYTNTTMVTFTGLNAATEYTVTIETQRGEHASVSTNFTTGRYWNDAQAWPEGQIPGQGGNMTANVPENTTVVIRTDDNITVNDIIVNDNSSIVIEEGGELHYANVEGVNVTMSMNGNQNRDHAGYRLIATPTYNNANEMYVSVESTGLMEDYDNADLYSFDQNFKGAEWRNYKNDEFENLELGKGYLYYAPAMFGMFTGMSFPSSINYPISLDYNTTGDVYFPGWNLLGNPYTCKAYPNMPFYVLNAEGSEVVASTVNYVLPMRGFFVVAETTGETCIMSTTAPVTSSLDITLNQNNNVVDAAIVRFDNGGNLNKIQFDANHTKIYMPFDGKDYAVLQGAEMGEMPVSFKAECNGNYTLSFTNDNVEFSYLHLIDNMTGNDVDLLVNPSYSFSAQTTDYASRFRLVYATGASTSTDNFAFFNSIGDLTIYGVEGTATLQVMDFLGHIISSEQFNGNYEQKLNVAPGVYMIRLVNGNDVKVQKIVVK